MGGRGLAAEGGVRAVLVVLGPEPVEGPLLPLKQWVMLTLVAETGQSARLYLNGKQVGESPSCPVLGPTAAHKLTIGRNAIKSPPNIEPGALCA